MPKIVYDYQVFCWQQYGGISRYIYELANQLSEKENYDIKILAMAYVNEYLKKSKPGLVIGFPVPKIKKTGTIVRTFNVYTSKAWLYSNPPDIVHETFFNPKKVASRKSKVVVTVYDMLQEKFPEFFPKYKTPQERAEAVKRADHVICISENTRKDLLELVNIDPHKVSVVHLAPSFNPVYEEQSEKVIPEPYILYVGDRPNYKNFHRLLQAYANSPKLSQHFKLVCFGGKPFSVQELETFAALEIPEGWVIHISGNDSVLARYYRGASVFVYPSLYEGFGIPPLEAMSLGCPVACSNTSSMPEVAGSAAEYFDPYDLDSIAGALEAVLYSSERSKELISFGLERVNHFSWKLCAEKTAQVYSSLL